MTSEPIAVETLCPACGVVVAPDAETCRWCHASIAAGAAKKSFVDARWFIICMMVFAALFLGFPLLWRSKAFSLGEKIFWTLFVTIETVVAFGACGWVMWRSWLVIQEAW